MKDIIRYVILASIAGLLEVLSAVFIRRSVAAYLGIGFNSISLVVFIYCYLYYRVIINKYLSLNLSYLGDKYKQPFLLRSFIGRWFLTGQADTAFTDYKALTTYKHLKVLQLIGSIFLAFAITAGIILILRLVK